jgi:hypothetical protein
MRCRAKSFRVGKVRAYLRGQVWYLQYVDGGRRRRPRVGPDRDQARQMAAQINGQLEVGAPAALSYEPISIPDLRQRWLDHHEHVRRSSLQTIRRYRAATEHLVSFVEKSCPMRHDIGTLPNSHTHVSGSQADVKPYRERIGDDRLRAAAEHVRQWLWGNAPRTARKSKEW